MNFTIKQCSTDDAELYTRHCITHMREKGIGGIYAHPFPSDHKWDEVEFLEKIVKSLTLQPFSPNWVVIWVAVVDGRFVGHLNLKCGTVDAQKHRMRLGMGIENDYRSQGIGKALMEQAIAWAKAQEHISWIDLSVFAKNVVARKMYASFGFKEQGTIEDALRVENEIIDDVQMTLKLS
ncbi:GNAT family N-acetyltransferase [Peredibacter sp. HCB2-198]|uniref:GNAT family N-acetyltransferase n=1 Tax=Peredibacter sp. HCB2-198 TaxID=3383025 RepID=UPI0038B6A5CB